jgi:hypothetical protein
MPLAVDDLPPVDPLLPSPDQARYDAVHETDAECYGSECEQINKKGIFETLITQKQMVTAPPENEVVGHSSGKNKIPGDQDYADDKDDD